MASTPSTPPQDAEEREALQYWGYLFKQDRTGTNKLKNLLRGLHKIIRTTYEPSECSDLTPTQLAQYYRAVDGNYDPLFVSTPPSSIAFIYKNLGCLHSLQPLPSSGEDRFSEPMIPALKVEGWIMWQTIQILLGPEEHSGFLRKAVQKWDIRNLETGETFPKILPRACFPAVPDTHMVAWYEGMGERLRREAEEEQGMRITAVEHESDAEAGAARRERRRIERPQDSSDDERVGSRSSALAYFRNPLYRTVDGRPGVVRRTSKRPPLTPRESLMERGKSYASTVGNVVRNVGSPHLWDGRAGNDKERDRRRRSLPDRHHFPGEDPDGEAAGRSPSGLHPNYANGRRHRGSRTPSPTQEQDVWDSDGSAHYSPAPQHHHHHHLRHHRSHEPHPSPKEYFPPFDEERQRRRSSAQTHPAYAPSPTQTGFGPSASPLFATHIARGEVPDHYRRLPTQGSGDHGTPDSASSSSRPPVGRYSGREDWERRPGSDDSGRRDQRSESGGRKDRAKVTRFDLPARSATGVHGRKYPVDEPWRS